MIGHPISHSAPSISIRRSLLTNLIIIIVLITAAIMASTMLTSRRIVSTLSRSIISQTLDQTEDKLERFFDPIRSQLLIARQWGEQGLIDLDDPEQVVRLFTPLMKEYPHLSSTLVAEDRGREQMILRAGEQWQMRRTRLDDWGDQVVWQQWTDQNPKRIDRKETIDYDPRHRPWYLGAMKLHKEAADKTMPGIYWTQPYIFYTTEDPGITASTTFTAPDGRTHVVGFDVLLNDISQFTVNLPVQAHGMVVVLTEDNRMVGLPADPRFKKPAGRKDMLLKHPEELGTPIAVDSNKAFQDRQGQEQEPFQFISEDRVWWAMGKPLHLSAARTLLIAVIVPESDLTGSLTELRITIMAILILVLIGAIFRARAMAKQFSEPIEMLVAESESISRGDLEKHKGIDSHIREVRKLARAHDHMRTGLASLMKLERDLQLAKQIQQQTFPDRLPQCKGFAIEAWSRPADETGGDTYDVIGLHRDVVGGEMLLTDGKADRAILLLADATGHGIGPALSVAQVRAMLRMAVRMGESLETISVHMNEQLCADLPAGRFVTTWLGELDAAGAKLTSFSAGQGPLLHYQAKTNTVNVLNADYAPFGVLHNLDVSINKPIELERGDIFAVISDGIFEATSAEGEDFGNDRVIQVIQQNRDKTLPQLLDQLREAVDAFTAGIPAEDDQTVILIKRLK